MSPRSGAFLAAILCSATPAVAGGPPFATDDAFVIAPDEIEFIPYLDFAALPGADEGEAGINASIGIAGGVQMGVIVPLHRITAGGGRFDLSVLTIQAKVSLLEDIDGSPALAFGPNFVLPAASGGRAEPGLDLPLWLSVLDGDWSLHAGGGYRFAAAADGGNLPFGGIVGKRALGEGSSIGVELFAEGGANGGKALVMAGPGFSWAISDRLALVAACHAILASRSVNGDVRLHAALVITP